MKPVTIQDVIQIFRHNQRLFVVLGVASLMTSVLAYTFVVPFVAKGMILSHDSQNSGIQAFVENFSGLQKSVTEGKKGNSALSKKIEILKSRQFAQQVASRMSELNQPESLISEELRSSLEKVFQRVQGDEVTQLVQSTLEVKLSSDFEITVSAKHLNPKIAFAISRVALEESQKELKRLEEKDLAKAQKFIKDQTAVNEAKLKEISQKMAKYQNAENAALPLASQERLSEYASELLVREQELKLKISENNKMIQILSQGKRQIRESKLYGVGGQIEALKTQNTMTRNQLVQTQAALKKIQNQTKSLPFEKLIYEDLKKRSEVEFGRYKELAEVENKLSAQLISLDSKFEIFQLPELVSTRPSISFFSLTGLALLVSFLVGSAMIYLKFMMTLEEESVQGTRDVMVFRDHNFDPSVILENSKIRFSLQKFLEENTREKLDSDTQAQQKID